MKLDLSPQAISSRVLQASDLSELLPQSRLDSKLDMSAAAVSRRLNEVFELLSLCENIAVKGDPEI